MFRKVLFWIHLTCGVVAGFVVLMMSVTGVILTYERQILAWEDRVYYVEPEAGQNKQALEDLIEAGRAGSDLNPSSATYYNDPASPLVLREGRSGQLFMNPYTGEIHEPHSETLDSFFSTITGLHRWFNLSGDARSNARAITGASNLMFLFLVLSGMYLWLPSVYRWSTMRLRLWFHPNARSGAARDFNWHHVFGFWSAIPLVVIVATASVFYYSWANNLVYRLAGEEPPQRGRGAPVEEVVVTPVPAGGQPLTLDELFATAARQSNAWNSLTLNLPEENASAVSFSIDEGNGGEPQKRHSLTLNAYTGEVVEWAPFSSQSAGRQARSWVRFLHTGEALGLLGQTIAGLASLAGAFLVWTGLALALRRFLRWIRRLNQRTTDDAVVADS